MKHETMGHWNIGDHSGVSETTLIYLDFCADSSDI